jgi:hypothetical protein
LYTADDDGEVIELESDKYIGVKYKNGDTRYYDLTPRLSTTKRATHINLPMYSLAVGDKFVKDQMIAWTNSFNGNSYVYGKSLCMAVMSYNGYSFEDGYAINHNVSDKFNVETLTEVSSIIPNEAKLMSMVSDLVDTKPGDVLLEFGYGFSVDDYLDTYGFDSSDDGEFNPYSKGADTMRILSPGGKIKFIKIFINNKAVADPLILSQWKKQVKQIKDHEKKLRINLKTDIEKLSVSDNLDLSVIKTGKLRAPLYSDV